MTAISQIPAGARLTASELQGVAPLAAYKGADETVTSSAVLQNDDALFVTVAANATYKFQLWLNYEGGTQGSSDLKIGWSLPSGATIKGSATYINASGGSVVEVYFTNASTLAAGTNGAASIRGFFAKGTLAVSSTGGTMQLQWAQNTSSGTGTIVHSGSELSLWQLL